jgi:hypothetical protein
MQEGGHVEFPLFVCLSVCLSVCQTVLLYVSRLTKQWNVGTSMSYGHISSSTVFMFQLFFL